MKKSLQSVQLVAKVFKVLSQIAFIFTVIAAVCTLLSGVVLLVIPELDEIAQEILGEYPEFGSISDLGIVLLAETLFIASQALVAYFALRYFKNELKAGTPFTHSGANEMLRLGIITLAVPAVALFFATVIIAIAGVKLNMENTLDLTVGIIYLLLSILLHYGAELEETAAKSCDDTPAENIFESGSFDITPENNDVTNNDSFN